MTVVVSGSNITFNDSSVQDTAATGFGFKNRIINGAMVIDQRNAGASGTSRDYTVDRWQYDATQAAKFTFGQNYGGAALPAGFINYLGFKTTTAYTVISTDTFYVRQPIEGLNVSDLAWGTASASAVNLSFQVYSSLTGTFGGALQNSASNRSYPFSFTVSTANTWTSISITIAGDTSGTWLTTNGIGIKVIFSLGAGSNYLGTANAWAGANYNGVTGQNQIVGTLNNTFYITGVQLEKGSTATSFDYRPYGTELNLCLRYFQKLGSAVGVAATSAEFTTATQFFVPMRTSPTLSASAAMSVTDTNTADFTQSSAQVSIVSGTRINTLGVNYSCSNFSGMTTNKVYITIPAAYSNGIILASAEL